MSLSNNILDRPLSKGNKKVSLSAFSFLFSEIVQYSQSRISQVRELQKRLYDLGFPIGQKILELYSFRDRRTKKQREIKVVGLLQFICGTVWKELFGKESENPEKAGDAKNRYHIFDKQPIEERFISKNSMNIHCCYFTAGIINGILHAANFDSNVKVGETQDQQYTVYVIDVNSESRK